MACAAGAIVILPAIKFSPDSWLVRLIALIAAGIAALSIFYTSAPQCVGSAFGQLDPLVRDYWLINVREGLPIWDQPGREIISLFGGSIIVGLASLVFIKWRRPDAVDNDKLFLLAYALLWAFIVSLLVQRAAAVAAVYALPFLGWAVHHAFIGARQIKRLASRILATAAVVFLILPGPLFLGLVNGISGGDEDGDDTNIVALDDKLICDSHTSLERLNAFPRSNIIAPFDFGPEILVQTPHNILATSHHRNDAAMADQIRIFTSEPEAARDLIEARHIRYIVACPDEPELSMYGSKHPDGLWAKLSKKEQPLWLESVHLRDSGLIIWRVVPKELRNEL